MERTILPRPLGGTIAAIASKSQAHRLLICAALADAPTEIICRDTSADIDATAGCLRGLGAEIVQEDDCFRVVPIRNPQNEAVLDCGESGSTLRFLLPVAAALGTDTTFVLHGRLPERPLSPLWELLGANGCTLSRPTQNTVRVTGKLHAGAFPIAGNISSQFISGLLFALALTGGESDIMLTTTLESADYIRLTLDALRQFGASVAAAENGWHIAASPLHSPQTIAVEGDWSNAAFWLCAGAISRPMTVTGLSPRSLQGDRKILDLLNAFGADVSEKENAVTVSPAPLHGIEIDARDIPDLVPPLALVAACCEGTTQIVGAARLRLKESDRLQSVAAAIHALGGEVEILPDGLMIHGGALSGGTVSAQGDHRIAMLAAVAASVCKNAVILRGAEAVNKSYPNFWRDYERLQAR